MQFTVETTNGNETINLTETETTQTGNGGKGVQTLNELLTALYNSNFACVNCGKSVCNVLSESISIEHILNHLADRENVKFWLLVCRTCNSSIGNRAKPYSVKQYAENNLVELNQTQLRYTFKQVVKSATGEQLDKLLTRKIAKENGIKANGSSVISDSLYKLKIELIDEVKFELNLEKIELLKRLEQIEKIELENAIKNKP